MGVAMPAPRPPRRRPLWGSGEVAVRPYPHAAGSRRSAGFSGLPGSPDSPGSHREVGPAGSLSVPRNPGQEWVASLENLADLASMETQFVHHGEGEKLWRLLGRTRKGAANPVEEAYPRSRRVDPRKIGSSPNSVTDEPIMVR